MGAFKEFSIPVHGLKSGVHQFKYDIDGAFFQHFESSPVTECDFQVTLELDKRSNMLVLNFELDGWMKAICDRCSVDIRMPMANDQVLFVKYTEDEGEEEDDDVIFMSRDVHEMNMAKYIYEFVVLSLPISNTYDCENEEPPPCDFAILDYLKQQSKEHNDDDTPTDSSIWDALKDLK